ncbi:hypothetical protein F442_02347 [Phytophthora nicotianae P10297]|uniref:Uncharacterized protein n=1 Tax=Phytophthora nicotianae P10297 TaxID=1317064 RepID=W3A0A0_PHYNI|nr:hypothetical protein F442_02347 [Phytophthora nicotianae P10297]
MASTPAAQDRDIEGNDEVRAQRFPGGQIPGADERAASRSQNHRFTLRRRGPTE